MAIGLPVKANYAAGDILTATNMNDLSGTFNNVATSYGNAAGKNKIINADMAVAQRGTSFTISSTAAYTLDRWRIESAGASTVVTQDAFTPGAAPVAGYESAFAMKLVQAAGGSSNTFIGQRIEDVRTFAGQTVTISFWAKATATKTVEVRLDQNFGSGGSGTAALGGTPQTVTTSWARYSTNITLGSLTGKTIGTNSYLDFFLYYNNTAATTISFWGVQIEAGSIATPFATASGGSIQGELAMCQRYYETGSARQTIRNPSLGDNHPFGAMAGTHFQVAKRGTPTITLGTATQTSCYTNSGNTENITVSGFAQILLVNAGGVQANMSITQPWTAAAEL